MNRYFEFSRRQLYFVAVLSFTAATLGGYATFKRMVAPEPNPLELTVIAGAPHSDPPPSRSTDDLVGTIVLDPNAAPADSLELLPGIGPAKAAAILACRDTLPFRSPEDLLRVDGIGPRTLEKMRPFIRIPSPDASLP